MSDRKANSYNRPRHQLIASILAQLNGELLCSHGCLFGGGTAMSMRYGEYRESVDIDFLVSHLAGYRALRLLLTQPESVRTITLDNSTLTTLREVRADQYGIRTVVAAADTGIKFEIVFEARMALEPPTVSDLICGIAALTPLDMLASKLLANSDRWADDSVYSRDLIDIVMQGAAKPLLGQAIAKAANAYGASIERDLSRAIAKLKNRHGYAEHCLKSLQMTIPKALLWKKLLRLQRALDDVRVSPSE